MSTSISTILNKKGSFVLTIDRGATVYDTIEKMVAHNVGSMIIVEGEMPCGIFTERDYLRRIAVKGRTSRETLVGDVMTDEVIFVDSNATIESCMAIMSARKIRHLPVMDMGRLVGIISIGDCVKTLSSQAQAQIDTLTSYISGGYPA